MTSGNQWLQYIPLSGGGDQDRHRANNLAGSYTHEQGKYPGSVVRILTYHYAHYAKAGRARKSYQCRIRCC
ncbi:hypothetical protein WG66_011960 [Moniliophthora roreri]|nr:hypothetical protein WG66_011960 [Moniliophthora roreri]